MPEISSQLSFQFMVHWACGLCACNGELFGVQGLFACGLSPEHDNIISTSCSVVTPGDGFWVKENDDFPFCNRKSWEIPQMNSCKFL